MDLTPLPEVLLFLKAPHPGFVKTRLAKDIGDLNACKVYQALVRHTLAQIPSYWKVNIHFAPQDAELEMKSWLGDSYRFLPQPEGDLGARMAKACEQAFESGASSVILLGGDCPGIRTQDLEEAASKLAQKKSVIGPALDGGYWTLGLSSTSAAASAGAYLFNDMKWSTADVFDNTIKRFQAHGISPEQLRTLEDVDDLECLKRNHSLFTLPDSLLKALNL